MVNLDHTGNRGNLEVGCLSCSTCSHSSLCDHSIGTTGLGICGSCLAGKLVFGLLVAVRDHSVQQAPRSSCIVTTLLCVVRFFGDGMLGFLVTRVVVVKVGG